MRRVVIKRGTMELASSGLTRPVVTIGRSPTCDVVLRVSGIKPVHFMLEWVGGGAFDSSSGHWSIFDISDSREEIGEGILLGDEPISFRGFFFQCREDKLASEWEGGSISGALDLHESERHLAPISQKGYLLELVQGRSDSGAIEEVVHVQPRRFFKRQRPLNKVPEFRVLWHSGQQASDIPRVLLTEMPGATIYRKGVALPAGSPWDLAPNELLEVRWNGYSFYLRLVPWRAAPKVPIDLFQDKLLMGLTIAGALLGIAIAFLGTMHPVPDQTVVEPPPRIAKVEIQKSSPMPAIPKPDVQKVEDQAPAPVEKPVEVAKEPAPSLKQHKEEEQASAPKAPIPVKDKQAPPAVRKNPSQVAAAPKVKPNAGPVKAGLNVPAPPKDVNTLGILGALKKTSAGPKGAGVRADQIVDQGLITSATAGDQGKVVLKSGAIGELGTGKKGSPKGKNSSLAAASTTLSGDGEYNPKATGPIAAPGGTSTQDYAAGDVLGKGTGGSEGNGLGSGLGEGSGNGNGSFQVSGGLTRDVVRAVIGKYHSQIRNCYERSLLVNSDLAGRILYQWKISPAGPVVSVQMIETEVHFEKLESCVRDVIRSMQFPAAENGQSTTVIYPFAFQSHKKS